MGYNRLSIRILGLLLILSMLIMGCSGTSSPPTLTINGDQCSYEGPKNIPAKATFTLKLENPKPSTWHGFGVLTLAEGKTLEDLKTATTVEDLPEWITVIGRFGSNETGTSTHEFDSVYYGAYHGEPIYILCVIDPAVIAAFGPIEVKP